jgi:hypothetical protein
VRTAAKDKRQLVFYSFLSINTKNQTGGRVMEVSRQSNYLGNVSWTSPYFFKLKGKII